MKMNESVFDDIIDTAQDCIFWKDRERRFVGVNQSFLDFYGFESADVLIGKTDEDMGWHNDPEPYKQDELRVLAGESTYKVLGKCMVKDEERDIIASKRPIYRGDEIIGLVGSFSDVTEVMRRKKDAENAQLMYTIDQLRQYPYFDRLLDEVRLEDVLDALTGIISRGYIFDFAKSLISSRTPFTFTIVDLDNFKDINDTYGHHAGDIVLMDVARELAIFTRDYGIVGRFGGDELLVINFRDIRLQEKERFFRKLYESRRILRKNIRVDGHEMFVTGTSGCATYPTDATDYDELFRNIDKALYQGKNKGRNCYTVYTADEHASIDVKTIARTNTYRCMSRMVEVFGEEDGPLDRLHAALPVLEEDLQIDELYYVDTVGTLRSGRDPSLARDVSDIDALMKEEIFTDSSLDGINDASPKLYQALDDLGVQAVLIVCAQVGAEGHGYLICAETRSQRLWQEKECAIVYFLARELMHCNAPS